MKAIIQRVSQASVVIKESNNTRSIGKGLMILLGVDQDDNLRDSQWLARKILKMRIFEDETGKMNLSLEDVDGEALVVSQFTLLASTRKGNRPSFHQAASPDKAIPLYENFVSTLSHALGRNIPTGEFGKTMRLETVNEGPVTVIIDSHNSEDP